MKNVIISALTAYIVYGKCEIKHLWIIPITFLIVWGMCADVDEQIKDLKRSIKRGQRLNQDIEKMKGVRL